MRICIHDNGFVANDVDHPTGVDFDRNDHVHGDIVVVALAVIPSEQEMLRIVLQFSDDQELNRHRRHSA